MPTAPTDDDDDARPLPRLVFDAEVIHWRGPAPYFFVAVPEPQATELRHAARAATYGWGMIPVTVALQGGAPFTTSLFPREGGYLLPLKDAVRHAAAVTAGDTVTVDLQVAPRR